jgi:hypothetical protein
MSLWAFRFVLFYLTILVVQPQNRFPFLWGFRLALIAMVIAMVLHVISATQEGKPLIRFGPATITALLVLVFAFISQHFGTFQRTSGWNPDIDIIFKNCVVLILIEAMATTVERVWAVLGAILLGTLWWIKGGLRLSSAGITSQGDRLWSPTVSLIDNPNSFAFMMALMIPIYLYFFQNEKNKWIRYGYLFCALSAVYIALETGSRTGMLCLVGCGLFLIPKYGIHYKKQLGLMAVALFFVAGSVSALNVERYKTIGESIRNFIGGGADGVRLEDMDPSQMTQNQQSAWERKMKNKHAWGLLKQHFLFGVGVHKNDGMIPDEFGFARGQVHNEWLYIGLQMGIIGIVLYSSLQFTIFFAGFKIQREAKHTWPQLADLGWTLKLMIGVYLIGGFFSPVGWNPILLAIAGASSALWVNYQNQSWNRATEKT